MERKTTIKKKRQGQIGLVGATLLSWTTDPTIEGRICIIIINFQLLKFATSVYLQHYIQILNVVVVGHETSVLVFFFFFLERYNKCMYRPKYNPTKVQLSEQVNSTELTDRDITCKRRCYLPEHGLLQKKLYHHKSHHKLLQHES